MPNIYLELELPLDPPLTEHAELTRELNKKIGEWNKLIAVKRDWLKILVVGFGLTVVSHGLYTSLCAVDLPGLAALLVGASFVLFYGYFAKIRLQIQQGLKKDINP